LALRSLGGTHDDDDNEIINEKKKWIRRNLFVAHADEHLIG